MGGQNAEKRLRSGGIEATRVNPSHTQIIPLSALWAAPEGHALHDPRSLGEPDEDMAQDMAERVRQGLPPNRNPIPAREETQEDGESLRMLVVDGHRRKLALGRAQVILRRAGVLGKDEEIRARVDLWKGTDAEVIAYRMRANDHGRYQRADSVTVLAFRVRQLLGLGWKEKRIAESCPRGVGLAEVQALGRFDDLEEPERARFDSGEAPIGILAAVLAAPRSQRMATIDKLIAGGVRTGKAATRRTNAEKASRDPWARRMSPRQLVDVANVARTTGALVGAACAAGLALAAVKTKAEADAILKTLPTSLADAIRAARAAKATKARAK
ncbi:MAG: hypothetical protein VW547_11315 [Alphaproteobacteria bacterium]